MTKCCFLSGAGWILKYYLEELRLQRVNLHIWFRAALFFSLCFLCGQGFERSKLSLIRFKFLSLHVSHSVEAKITEINAETYDVVTVIYCQRFFFSVKERLHYSSNS
jgi:hypothetical protein